MKAMSLDNRYAFLCGVAVYAWQNLLNIPTDLFIGIVKAGLFGAAGMAGKELFTYIKKALVAYNLNQKIKRIMATLSYKNAKHPAPRWFRKMKKAVMILTAAANVMIAQWGFTDQLLTLKLQLWCTIGIAAILEAVETCLKDDDGEDQPDPKTEAQ